MKFHKYPYALLLAICVLPACKIVLQLPDGGEIKSASGTRDCAESECTIDWDGSEAFTDTFTPVPPGDDNFVQWRKEPGYLCGGTTEPCAVSLPAHPAFAADVSIYLEPIFQTLSGERSSAPPEPDASDRTYAKTWAPSSVEQCTPGENQSPSVAPFSEQMATTDFDRSIFEPAIVFTDEVFTMMRRSDVEATAISLVDLWSDFQPFIAADDGSEPYLYDDGTHGDITAGDGVFTRDCLAIDLGLLGYPDDYDQARDLFYVNPALRGTESVTAVSDAVRMNDSAIFVSLGEEYSDAMGRGRHWEIFNPGDCTSCWHAWHHFGDIFEFFVIAPRQAYAGLGYTRVHDFIEGTGHEPPYPLYSYWNITMDDGKEHPEYVGMVYSGWPFSGGGLSHELGHGLLGMNTSGFPGPEAQQWNAGDGAHLDADNTLTGNLQGPLWDPIRGFPTPVKVDDGSSENWWELPDARLGLDENGEVILVPITNETMAWDEILLYMMGLIEAGESTKTYYKVINPSLTDCISEVDAYVCSGTKVNYDERIPYSIETMIERYGAWRSNQASYDPTRLEVGMLHVSDRYHTQAEIVVHTRVARKQASTTEVADITRDEVPWYWSTGERSRLVVDFRNYLLPSQ